MDIFKITNNLDLLAVGIAISTIGILGFSVYFNDKENITNRTFFYFALAAIFWGTVNYLNYQFASAIVVLWLLRLVIFFAVWYSFFLFQFFYVFPKEKVVFPKWYKFFLIPLVTITSIVNLTPLAFHGIVELAPVGQVSRLATASGIYLFVAVIVGLVFGAFFFLIKKMWKINEPQRLQYKFIAFGTFFTFFLLIIFNLILPVFFLNRKFIPLGAVFTFPFIFFTSLTIIKHRLFNIRVIGPSILVFALAIVSFIEVTQTNSLTLIIYRSAVFIFVLVFGILLIRGILKEIEQYEKFKKLSIELATANEKLKSLDNLKTEFLSLATHQLRSPITAIKGYSSMLLDGSYGSIIETQKDPVDKIFRSSERMNHMITRFLDVAKIEQGGMKYTMQLFGLEKVAEEIVNEFSITAKEKGLTMTFETDNKSPYMINADKEQLWQVIQNLVDNSMKYTKEGWIKVKLSKDEKRNKIILSISDSGMGIRPEILPALFHKFSRGEGNKMNTDGSGIGLYLAKEIIEKGHNGRIWAESQGADKGATFSFELDTVK